MDDGITITDAVLSIYGYTPNPKGDDLGIAPNLNIYSSNPASNTSLVPGDFDSVGSTAFATAIDYDDWVGGAYNDFTLNASGIAAISKTGVSKFSMRNANYDALETPPAWSSNKTSMFNGYAAEEGEGYKPKLVVTYEGGATEKESSDSGTGSDVKASYPIATLTRPEAGSGVGTSSLLAALTGTGETGLGSELAAKFTGEALSDFDSGSGGEVAALVAVLTSGDSGTGSDLSGLPEDFFGVDEGGGFDALKALIGTAGSGSDMRLPGRTGQVRIPSKGVNL